MKANQTLQTKMNEQERLLSSLQTERNIQAQQQATTDEEKMALIHKLSTKVETAEVEAQKKATELEV